MKEIIAILIETKAYQNICTNISATDTDTNTFLLAYMPIFRPISMYFSQYLADTDITNTADSDIHIADSDIHIADWISILPIRISILPILIYWSNPTGRTHELYAEFADSECSYCLFKSKFLFAEHMQLT
jgi:hypothetical protein